MQVDLALILKLEKLSRLELSETERTAIQNDLNNILSMVAKMNELNTDGVEPLIYMSSETAGLREDIVKNHLTGTLALDNAPDKNEKFFQVPKVVSK